MEDRKQREAEFHDSKRVYESDPQTYASYLSNKKFYSVTSRSREYFKAQLNEYGRDGTVLDYGCGAGGSSFEIARVAKKVVGIDVSGASIAQCREEAVRRGIQDSVEFHVMDAEQTTFPDQSFDAICVNGVLHHMDLDSAYPELARLVKPSGGVVCNEAMRHNPLIHRYRKRTPHLRTEWEVEHILGEPEIDSANKYFGSVDKRFFHLASLAAVPLRNKPYFDRAVALLSAVDSVLLSLPYVRRNGWICVFVLSRPKLNA